MSGSKYSSYCVKNTSVSSFVLYFRDRPRCNLCIKKMVEGGIDFMEISGLSK